MAYARNLAAGSPTMSAFPLLDASPRNVRAPGWVAGLVEVVRDAEAAISTPAGGRLESDGVLVQLAGGLAALGYTVEKGKKA